MRWIDDIPLFVLVIIVITLGLAPFLPEPHVWQKLQMLFSGTLVQPIDWFDLLLHGSPWIILGIKLVRLTRSTPPAKD